MKMQIIERHNGTVVEVIQNDYTVFCAEFDGNGFIFCSVSSEENGIEDEYTVEFSGSSYELTKEQKVDVCKK